MKLPFYLNLSWQHKHRSKWLFVFAVLLLSLDGFAAAPFGTSTFHSISLYWNPASVEPAKRVLVKYRVANTQAWYQGYPMHHNNVSGMAGYQKAVYRSSLVNLTPATTYEIVLTEEGAGGESETLTLTTLDENLNGSPHYTMTANSSQPLTITAGGTPGNYKIYDGANHTIDLGRTQNDGIVVDADWVIIRNFNITNTKRHGINIVGKRNHIVIEGCDISHWGDLDRGTWRYVWKKGTADTTDDEILTGPNQDTTKTQFGEDHHSAIYAFDTWDGPNANHIIIQRNKLHHPNYDTNNWTEPNGCPYDQSKSNKEPNGGWKHPHGPGTTFLHSSGGGNVIRYNEIWSDGEHYIHDGIGGGYNSGKLGFPGPDSDIYGNYVSYCNDDGFEIEGGVQNVRVWNNFAENCYVGFANAAVRIGPLYVWRNVFGNGTRTATGSIPALYNIKMGTSGQVSNMTGDQYFFNNTWYSTNGLGYQGVGTTGGNNREIKHTVFRNNIFQTRHTTLQAISRSAGNEDIDLDYDLIGAPAYTFPAGQERFGKSGAPSFVSGWGLTGSVGMGNFQGNFQLADGARGKDSARKLPNFCAAYNGAGPDVGAHEGGLPAMTFGLNASFVPLPPNDTTTIPLDDPPPPPNPTGGTAFGPGNLAVLRTTASGTIRSGFIDEYTLTGNLVRSIALPTVPQPASSTSNKALTFGGGGTDHMITLSDNGQWLSIPGFNVATSAGTAPGGSDPRTIGRLGADGVLNSTTLVNFASSRTAVATNEGDAFYLGNGGSPGIGYVPLGESGATVINSFGGIRYLQIKNNQLYFSTSGTGIRIGTVGNDTLPVEAAAVAPMPAAIPTSGSLFAFQFLDADPDVPGVDLLYYANDLATDGNVFKYSKNRDSSWTARGSFSLPGTRNLTARLNRNGTATLIAVRITGGNSIMRLEDAAPYNADMAVTASVVRTVASGMAFRSVAFAPGTPMRSAQKVTLDSIPDKTFGDVPFVLNAEASSGLDVGFATSDSSVAVVVDGELQITGAGTVTITAYQNGDNAFFPADSVSRRFNVGKASQTIHFDAVGTKTFGDDSVVLTATASSSLSVSFEVVSGPATLNADTLTLTAPGEVVVKAWQAGNNNYLPADTTQRFTVLRTPQTIMFTQLGTHYIGDSAVVLLATASSGLPLSFRSSDSSIAQVVGDSLRFLSAGTVVITASQEGNAIWAPVDTTQTLTVRGFTVKVQHQNSDRQPGDNSVRPIIRLVNADTLSLPYKELTVRYWLTPENFAGLNTWALWLQWGGLVKTKYVPLAQPHTGAFGYVEYSFPATAINLNAGTTSNPVIGLFANNDWAALNEGDDYSYQPYSTAYADNSRITLYRNGQLIWGEEPAPVPAEVKLKVLYENRNNRPTGRDISNNLVVVNEGNVPVDYKDVEVRYWFTPDGSASLNYWVDYAKLGSNNFTGSFTAMPSPTVTADTYFGLKTTTGYNGVLYPLSNSGDIRLRIAKSDWSGMNESNDWSRLPKAPLAPNAKVTVYHKGALVWGQEPVDDALTMQRGAVYNGQKAGEALSEEKELQAATPQTFAVYPNPVRDRLFIRGIYNLAKGATVQLYNSAGRLVAAKLLTQGTTELDVSRLAAGGYWLRITNGTRVTTQNVVVE